ncbi:extracellular solute-binding protein [Streptomyces sp. HUCO-GS316]|uniref:ABC transporter substrate-binding protein n=1 Tax=Streptomyces sp. HUCO-GS316 TaxID=2692198 RepID=UPI00136BC2A5|nr:ABC transporter substrate-binding protein [Streptomyces sp. HUCO-GS316]MXM65780.1 extracellular solute-binding protein [Streptomyces sp. HUCO-GS316]
MQWARTAGGGLLAGALLLTGCTGDGSAELSSGTDEITFVTGGDITDYLRDVLGEWNRSHPREKVKVIELPEAADEVRAQMASGLRSGSSRFDVLNIDVTWTSDFAAAGWITPVDGDRFPLGQFLPPVVDTATFRGQLYAVPYVTNAGLLYYRKDILRREGRQPPRTWRELEQLAKSVAPKYGLDGYAGQYLPYEGLTVNLAEVMQSAGGQILNPEGTRVAVDSAAAREGLGFLSRGVRDGWIPRRALAYKEEESRLAFQNGRLLFLRNWPYVYDLANDKGSKIAGKVGVVPLPGPNGQGSSILGGSNLAINTHSAHKKSASELISYLTSARVQREVLTQGSLPPVRAALYTDPALIRRFPYLPTLKQSILTARPRPKSPNYEQVSLAVQAVGYDALAGRQTPDAAVARLARELNDIVR